jgi:hypothetical protein
MKFVFGVAVGAIGMWAYQNGKLDTFTGAAPEPVRQAWGSAADQVGQMVNSDTVRQVGSTVQDKIAQARAPEIATPTAAEVSGRPSEPFPTPGA